MPIGALFDSEGANLVKQIMDRLKNKVEHLPVDFIIADSFKAEANTQEVTIKQGIPENWMGLDIGVESIKGFQKLSLNLK